MKTIKNVGRLLLVIQISVGLIFAYLGYLSQTQTRYVWWIFGLLCLILPFWKPYRFDLQRLVASEFTFDLHKDAVEDLAAIQDELIYSVSTRPQLMRFLVLLDVRQRLFKWSLSSILDRVRQAKVAVIRVGINALRNQDMPLLTRAEIFQWLCRVKIREDKP